MYVSLKGPFEKCARGEGQGAAISDKKNVPRGAGTIQNSAKVGALSPTHPSPPPPPPPIPRIQLTGALLSVVPITD